MTQHRILFSTLASAVAGLAAVGLIAGCSSASGSSTTAAATGAASGNAAYSAYASCLTQHGVTLPSRGAYGAGRRSRPAGFTFTPRAGHTYGGAGGFGGAFASADPSMAAAMQACASLRPTGAAGGGGFGGGSTRLAAFRNCMTQQGEAVPTTRPTAAVTAAPTGDARYLNGLDPAAPEGGRRAQGLRGADPDPVGQALGDRELTTGFRAARGAVLRRPRTDDPHLARPSKPTRDIVLSRFLGGSSIL